MIFLPPCVQRKISWLCDPYLRHYKRCLKLQSNIFEPIKKEKKLQKLYAAYI